MPVLDRLLAASSALPTWTRWMSWLAAAAVVFLATAFRHPAWAPVATAVAGFAVFASLPALDFDGPLPFSSAGVHASGGEVVTWDDVVRVEDGGPRRLLAVVADGGGERPVTLRTRGRSRDELRAALAAHRPEKVAF